jgi:hypothetical protein
MKNPSETYTCIDESGVMMLCSLEQVFVMWVEIFIRQMVAKLFYLNPA